MTAVEAVAMILSVVALAVTVLGFFASLKFYRDGTEMQQAAVRALAAIEEKANSIQHHVGGMFERTLDAAINRRDELSGQYEELRRQMEATTETLIEKAANQIGEKSQTERARIATVIQAEMAKVEEKVDSTQEAAEEIAAETSPLEAETGGAQLEVLRTLARSEDPLPLSVIAKRCDLTTSGLSFIIESLRRKKMVEVEGLGKVAGLVLTSKGQKAVESASST